MTFNLTEESHMEKLWPEFNKKFETLAEQIGLGFPFLAQNNTYIDVSAKIPDGKGLFIWTNGFWPGMLWQMYHVSKNDEYKVLAEELGNKLSEALPHSENLSHDVGFMFMLSAVAEYNETHNPEARKRALKAADILASRFNPQGNFIRAWNKSHYSDHVEGWMIADCMMNIQLLFWASRETGDNRYAAIAKRHADSAMEYLQRSDGSCNHIVEFSNETGEFIQSHTGQGYASDSAWSRGQAWAVYGFALCYRNTKEEKYLEAAKKSAHYCIANLATNDWLPLVDFKAPEIPVKYDSAAGTILSCSFHEIAQHVSENEKALYLRASEKTLSHVAEKFGNWETTNNILLEGGSLEYHGDRFANEASIYGDYFLVEAILRLKNEEMGIW